MAHMHDAPAPGAPERNDPAYTQREPESPRPWPATVALPGSVSTGTLNPDDLISAFIPVLKELDADRCHKLIMSQPATFRTDPDALSEFLMELTDALEDCAPAGYRFGTHEGDGADFGFWETGDEFDADIGQTDMHGTRTEFPKDLDPGEQLLHEIFVDPDQESWDEYRANKGKDDLR